MKILDLAGGFFSATHYVHSKSVEWVAWSDDGEYVRTTVYAVLSSLPSAPHTINMHACVFLRFSLHPPIRYLDRGAPYLPCRHAKSARLNHATLFAGSFPCVICGSHPAFSTVSLSGSRVLQTQKRAGWSSSFPTASCASLLTRVVRDVKSGGKQSAQLLLMTVCDLSLPTKRVHICICACVPYPTEKKLAIGGKCGFLYIFSMDTEQELWKYDHGYDVSCTTFSPDGA